MPTRITVYGPTGRGSKGSGGPSPRLASIGSKSMASMQRSFHQSRSDIAARLGNTASRGVRVERLAAMGVGGSGFNQLNPGPPADACHDQDDRGHEISGQQELGADSPNHAVEAFTNQAASTPGRNGVPFGKRGPAAGLPAP